MRAVVALAVVELDRLLERLVGRLAVLVGAAHQLHHLAVVIVRRRIVRPVGAGVLEVALRQQEHVVVEAEDAVVALQRRHHADELRVGLRQLALFFVERWLELIDHVFGVGEPLGRAPPVAHEPEPDALILLHRCLQRRIELRHFAHLVALVQHRPERRFVGDVLLHRVPVEIECPRPGVADRVADHRAGRAQRLRSATASPPLALAATIPPTVPSPRPMNFRLVASLALNSSWPTRSIDFSFQ